MWNPQKAGYLLRNILGSKVVKTNLKGLPYQLFCYQRTEPCGTLMASYALFQQVLLLLDQFQMPSTEIPDAPRQRSRDKFNSEKIRMF
ncbi:hypothetical protein TNCV_3579931 [Trichonephila clavipes]|nr:hypothetical protein TNCV_3579931 [Trichonephila clavipes]